MLDRYLFYRVGFCFGTILMRSSDESFYYDSIRDILKNI